MVRLARIVIPDLPHHVTNRGNRGDSVFNSVADRERFLSLVQHYSRLRGVAISAYCLMDNHYHIVAVPNREYSLARMMGPMQMRHAQSMNAEYGWDGHLWSDRYFSTPLDHDHFVAAIRYVELNPVRAGLVHRAEDYPWSSARSHVFDEQDPLLSKPALFGIDEEIVDWARWLAEANDVSKVKRLRECTRTGYPCGSIQFLRYLSRRNRCSYFKTPRGRKPGS